MTHLPKKSWNMGDDEKLMQLIGQNKSIDEISIGMGRTVGAIRTRLQQICKRLYEDGNKLDYIKKTIKIFSDEEIKNIVKTDKIDVVENNTSDDNVYESLKRIENILAKIVVLLERKNVVDDKPFAWTEQLLKKIKKNVNDKTELKKLRRENGIPFEEFYNKVNDLKD